LSHPRRGVEVDLHHNLAPPVSRIKIAPEVLWEGSRVVDDPDGEPLRVLAATDLVIHNAVHLFMNDELRGGLRDVVDFRDLFNHFVTSESEFGSQLLARAQQLGCCRPLYYATDTAVRLAGLSPDPGFLAELKQHAPPLMQRGLMRRLIDRLLAPVRPGIRSAAVAEHLLFIRSHWIRMPPLMLARHLAHKALKSKTVPGAEPDLPG
jgi:hypothetical protein